jgi:uncharacterized protein YifN (PemK superfamily)
MISFTRFLAIGSLVTTLAVHAQAKTKEITTNNVHMAAAPEWVTTVRVDKIVGHIQSILEWDIRRIEVTWYDDQVKFEKVHNKGSTVLAFARQNDSSVHIGPRVKTENFDAVFGHELAHVISYQKYKGAIPAWLEEGLANYLAHDGVVNYQRLAKHAPLKDVSVLTHPFELDADEAKYRYQASQALVEMIAKKCDLTNLLRLSVGKKIEDYLPTYCEIKDLTGDFNAWVVKHAPEPQSKSASH